MSEPYYNSCRELDIYEDTEFAHPYPLKKEELLLDEDRRILYLLMKEQFI